jgi:hypothetical protein
MVGWWAYIVAFESGCLFTKNKEYVTYLWGINKRSSSSRSWRDLTGILSFVFVCELFKLDCQGFH